MNKERRDIHQEITDQIIAAIEAGAHEFCLPWHRAKGSLAHPINVASGKRYQGVNVLSLWVAADAKGYPAGLWGTYRQWQAKGAQVRKGEKASLVVFYKELEIEREDDATGETTSGRVLMARASPVFNVAQVDGYALPDADAPSPSSFDANETAEVLMRSSGATIVEGGDRAFYRPLDDTVHLPDRGRFTGTETMSAQEAFYATGLHELTHWTGAKHRLDRAFGNRFGSRAYAFEELVAELGASYLCAELGVTTNLRPDHAAYIAHWLDIMREDKKAIFTAASAAQKAADYLMAFAPPAPEPDLEPERPVAGTAPVPTPPQATNE